MTLTFDSYPRRDGKFKVTLSFPGAPNAFGGFYPTKVFNKLYTLDKLLETIDRHGNEQQKQWAAKRRQNA